MKNNLTNLPKLLTGKIKSQLQVKSSRKLMAICFVFGFAILGTYLIFATRAASPFVSVEPELGTKSANVATVNDSTASGSLAVKFNTATTPPASEFPNASNTGVPAGTILTASGTMWISTPGTVVDSKEVTGCIHVRANNVTIKRTRVKGSCPGGGIDTDYGAYSGIVIEDVEIDGLNQSSGYALLGNSGFTCRRCHIHNGGSGIRMTSNVTVEDSYVHSLYGEPLSHNSAIGSNAGRDFVLRHNNIDCGDLPQCSGALVFYAQPSVDNALVENNLINGGGFCTYGGYNPKEPWNGTYIRYINNKFGRTYYPNCGYHGPVAFFNINNPGNEWRGNAWADTGEVIPVPGI